jgi:hypothetical protein
MEARTTRRDVLYCSDQRSAKRTNDKDLLVQGHQHFLLEMSDMRYRLRGKPRRYQDRGL